MATSTGASTGTAGSAAPGPSSALPPATAARLKDPDYVRWVRVGLGLLLLKLILTKTTERVMNAFYRKITRKVMRAGGCSCTFQSKTPLCTTCASIQKDIINVHKHKRAVKNIYWQNCVPSLWLTCSWEMAKCFMGRGQTPQNTGPTETDTSNLVMLWDTCDEFQPLIANKGLLQKVLTVRNKVMHSAQMTCSVTDMTSAFAAMIDLIKDPTLSTDKDIDSAKGIKDLENIRDATIDIMTEDEIKVWQDLINIHVTTLKDHGSQIDSHDTKLTIQSQALATLVTDVGTQSRTVATLRTDVASLKSRNFDKAINDFLAANPELMKKLTSYDQIEKQQSDLQRDINALYSRTYSERQRLNTLEEKVDAEHQSTKDSDEVLKELRGELKDTYLRKCSEVQPIPWLDRKLPLQEVFVPMTLRRSGRGSYSQGQEGERSVQMDDIFRPVQAESPPPRRVLVECTPGGGKSTLCQKLVYSWAQDVEASSPELSARTSTAQTGHHSLPTPTHPEPVGGARPRLTRVTEKGGLYPSLAGFAIVLLLVVRNLVVGDLSNNLLTLLVGESWRSRQEELRTCLANNCQQVLVILDGCDEAEVPHKDILKKILGDEWMKGCTILVTSRPGFCKSPFDVIFDLEGFDHQKRVRYINRYMEVVKGVPDHPCVSVLLHRLESPGIIGDLCQTPLFLVLVCVLSGQEGNALPDTRTELYEQFLSFLRRQAVERHGFEPDCMSSLQHTLQAIAFALLKDNTTDISLATIEQHSATQPSMPGLFTVKHYQPTTARADVTLRALCQVGFLIQNYKLKGFEEVTSGSFIHQSFVDYFAAKHFVTIPKEQRETFIVENRSTMFHNVFVHVAGLAAGRRELLVELFDVWRWAVAALGAPRFDQSNPVREMDRMYYLTKYNRELLHDAPFSWLAESADVCSASLALLTHGRPEAVCLMHECTESCVRGVRTLVKGLSGLQASPAAHPLHLGLYNSEQLGAAVLLDVLKQVGLTHGAVDCVRLEGGVYDGWTVRDCESLAALPACTRLKVIQLFVWEWAALDALSVSFTSTHALQELTVVCICQSWRGVQHSQHLTEFRRNVRCLTNIQQIWLRGWREGKGSAETERDLRDWGARRGVQVRMDRD